MLNTSYKRTRENGAHVLPRKQKRHISMAICVVSMKQQKTYATLSKKAQTLEKKRKENCEPQKEKSWKDEKNILQKY